MMPTAEYGGIYYRPVPVRAPSLYPPTPPTPPIPPIPPTRPFLPTCVCTKDCFVRGNGCCCCSNIREPLTSPWERTPPRPGRGMQLCHQPGPWFLQDSGYHNGLFGTSRLVRKEATRIFFGKNQFYFEAYTFPAWMGTIHTISANLFRNSRLIRRLCFMITWIFGAPDPRRRPDQFDELFACVKRNFTSKQLQIKFVIDMTGAVSNARLRAEWFNGGFSLEPLKTFCRRIRQARMGTVEVLLPQPGSKVNEVPQSYYTVKDDPTRNRTMEQDIDSLHAADNLMWLTWR